MKALQLYTRTKRWVLIVVLIGTCFIGKIPRLSTVPNLYEAFLAATALLLLEFFLEIHAATAGRLNTPLAHYNGITEVIPQIIHDIRQCDRPEGSTLQVIAISGSHVLPALRTSILERVLNNVKIQVTLVAPEFAEHVLEDSSMANQTRVSQHDTAEFVSTYSSDLQRANVQIDLIMHEYTPIIHGFIINREILYVATADRQPRFSGAHNVYHRLSVSQSLGRELIRALGNWGA